MLFVSKNKVHHNDVDQSLIKDDYTKKNYKKGPLFSKDDARIITSGKVYRQLFESEVQLINALQKVKYTTVNSLEANRDFVNRPFFNNHSKNYLSSMNGFHETNYDKICNKEVMILPENLLPSKTQSELIVKMIECRKLKFNLQFEELQQSIGIINKDAHSAVSDICRESSQNMTFTRNAVESHFTMFETNEAKNLSWDQFQAAATKNNENFVTQTAFIEQLYYDLLTFEDNRVRAVLQQISQHSTKLERIGHLAPSEVHRIINNLLIEANDSILRNKEMYCDLLTKLMLSNIEDNRRRQIFIKNQIHIWKQNISDFYFSEFKNQVEIEETNSLSTIKELLIVVDDIILKLSSEIKEVYNDIKYKFCPENYDSNYLNQTNTKLLNVILQFDNHSDIFITSTRAKAEEIGHKYVISMNDIKMLLLKMHVFENEEEATKIVESFCWPILGSLHKSFEKTLDSIEIITEEICGELKNQSRKLYNYLSSLLYLWNEHKVSLNKAEENLCQKLNINRDSHRQQNLVAENDLNLIIDKMRQDSNEHALKDNLSKCVNQLDKIKTSYSQFYNQQINITKRYPSLVESEIKVYEEKLSDIFNKNDEKKNLQDEEEGKVIEGIYEVFRANFMPLKFSSTEFIDLEEKLANCYNKFIKEWFKTVATNALKMVSTKIEELDSELKLRFHLHEPRYHRIEYDIHNVRAAELVIHAERVTRQCKFIDNSLEKIKQEYLKLDEVQRLKQDDFRNQLISVELSYASVTNHTKLMNIKVMLEDRNNQYMYNLRTSLSTFRQNIENNLQNLRQSNAEFVRSFKLFSAGGNFCPGEIDDFNKRIEKANLKVEEVESDIMSSLEMVEKNHQDNLIQLKNDFEDKFKYHIVDINFLEIINRAISELQLKIKTEVSNSNSQSQFICEKIKLLDIKFKEILSNPFDGHSFIDQTVLTNILAIFGCINDRSMYLDCIKVQGLPKYELVLVGDKEEINLKVQFISLTTISKSGRQLNEDAGIKSVKSLLRSQKDFIIKNNIESAISSNASELQKTEIENGFSGNQSSHLPDNTNKCDQTRSASINSEIATIRRGNTEKGKLVNKNQRLDKKYQAFGEDDLNECLTFLKRINCFCRDILDGILYSSELYYRNKGVRKVTQTSLQDNFDQAADDIITKLKYYFKQAKDYHDECLDEFNKQLERFEEVLCMFPSTVFKNVVEKIINDCTNEINEVNKSHTKVFHNLSTKRKCNYNELRPDLSQTSKGMELANILEKEESLYNEELNQIENQFQSNKRILLSSGKLFCTTVSNVTEQLLLLMDNLLTSNDIRNCEPKARFVNTNELVRKQAILPTELMAKNYSQVDSTKNTWTFNDLNDILQRDTTFKNDDCDPASKCLITAKYTKCHVHCIKDREMAVIKFKRFYFELLSEIDRTEKRMRNETNCYKSFWDESVKKLLEMNNI